MAIIKVGAPLSGIRGTLGGITYSQNGTSTYAKQWSKGPNPRTPKQSLQRTLLARMPELWQALSNAQRTAWGTFAALPAQDLINPLGETYSASGYNWFTKTNIRLLRVDRATISATPTQARPAPPTIDAFRVTPAGTDNNVAVGGTPSASTFEPSNPPALAFDNNIGTAWRTLFGNVTGFLQYILTSSRIIRRYTINVNGTLNGAPMDWTFERLDPGPTWTVLQTVSGVTWSIDETKDFYCANETPSTTYRINITLNGGHPLLVQINEMAYFEATQNGSVVIYPEDDFVDGAGNFDLILHVSQGATAARQTQFPGFLETLAIQDPNRLYSLFQNQIETNVGLIQKNRTWFARLFRQTNEGIRSAAQTAFITTS